MNAEQLLTHFDRVTDAPDATMRLRRLILELAVRGRLVDQDPNGEPELELLDRLARAGTRCTRGANGWVSTELGAVLEMRYGKGLAADSRKERGSIPVFGSNGVVAYAETPLSTRPAIVIGRKGSAGALNVCDGPSWTTDVAYFVEPPDFFNIRYLLFSLEVLDLGALGKGVKPGLSRADAYPLSIAVPPIAEQQRIVAKVDELMGLCDELAAAQSERESRRDRLAAASLHRLNEPGDDSTFREHARFHLDNLSRLTTRPHQVGQLRETILSLAVRGQLITQAPKDEPVSVTLTSNDEARRATAKEDRRADEEPQVLLAGEHRWAVPSSWAWRALGDLALFIDYRGKTPNKVSQGVRLITAKNVKRGAINLAPAEFLSESDYESWMTRGLPKVGDVLFTTEAPMGNAAVVRLPERFALAQRVIDFRSYGAVDPGFLVVQLLSAPFQSVLDLTATGLTAKGIKGAKLKRLPIAVPPLAEQRRIVARVGELMVLCDRLEGQLSDTEAARRHLLEALLHEALATAA